MLALITLAVWIQLSLGLALVLGRAILEGDRHNSIWRNCRSGLLTR